MAAKDETIAQLDSVTDRVEDNEACDTSKATAAMSSLVSGEQVNKDDIASVEVSKDDVALLVSELEITDDRAIQVLKEVTTVGEALRKLVAFA
jgi:NACalpha-BTF3-like transcription factor|eukprot:scaffold395_cov265-Chaetoceros_neogracile.AAC.34